MKKSHLLLTVLFSFSTFFSLAASPQKALISCNQTLVTSSSPGALASCRQMEKISSQEVKLKSTQKKASSKEIHHYDADRMSALPIQNLIWKIRALAHLYDGECRYDDKGVWDKSESVVRPGSGIRTMDPRDIGFSQSSVTNIRLDRATGVERTFDDLVNSMRKKGWAGDPVDVVRMNDGVFTSMDNTRILAARTAGIKVQTRVREMGDLLSPAEIERFTKRGYATPKTWGEAINIRIQSQPAKNVDIRFPYSSWGDRFPNGSLYDPLVE